MKAKSFFIFISICFLFGCSTIKSRKQDTSYWPAASIASSEKSLVNLYDPTGRIHLATVSRSRVQRVLDVGEKVTKAAGSIRPIFLIASGESPNAFAWYSNENPIIAINIGMLGIVGEYPDKAAALIGHELAHLYRGHGAAKAQRENIREGAAIVLGVVLSATGVPMGGTIAEIASTAVTASYTRDQEREADTLGVHYMKKAGYSPQGAVALHQHFSTISSTNHSIPFLGTHPSTAERIENLKKLAVSQEKE